jgi:hypothetical protein
MIVLVKKKVDGRRFVCYHSLMTTQRHGITEGLHTFHAENCITCANVCALDTSVHRLGVSAPELRTIGTGICLYHQNTTVTLNDRYEAGILDYSQRHVQQGVTLVQRVVRILSGGDS